MDFCLRKAHSHTAICEPSAYVMKGPQNLTNQ
jgi:hypothetical protein